MMNQPTISSVCKISLLGWMSRSDFIDMGGMNWCTKIRICLI